ncbi:MAG: hypothetical protein ACR2PB_05345 [Desulfocapsaceae bacterium]
MIDQTASLPSLRFSCSESDALRLSTVLQSGFFVTGTEGDSIYEFLMNLPGFTEEYLAKEVQTIFYNGDALDDLESALAGERATVALGSAMPGLVGAIMKKGSICGALRKPRTVLDVSQQGKPVEVRVKLFNTVARDMGPGLFTSGIRIDARDLYLFLELRPGLVNSFLDITIDNNNISSTQLIEELSSAAQLRVEVNL